MNLVFACLSALIRLLTEHNMRRTKPTHIYRRTQNLRAVQLLLGHTKLESTVRYLGIEVDNALELVEQTNVGWKIVCLLALFAILAAVIFLVIAGRTSHFAVPDPK